MITEREDLMDERKEFTSTTIFVEELRSMEREGWYADGDAWTERDGRARVRIKKRIRPLRTET